MVLADLLTPERIRLDLQATDKWDLIEQLLDIACEALEAPRRAALRPPPGAARIRAAVLDAEKRHSTGIGHGCAMPHARIPGLEKPIAYLAVLPRPLDYGSPDGIAVRVVCLLLVPADQPALPLKILAEIAGRLSESEVRDSLHAAADPKAIHALLRDRAEKSRHTVTARSIMRPPRFDIHPDTPLTVVTQLMQEHGVEASSVTERDGTLVGEIHCDLLFRSGMPEFFGRLHSVAFLRNFDPFDRYFEMLKSAVARDVMSTRFAAVPETATLLEVVFELSVRNHEKVFVVRDGKRIGVIDRSAVLSRILSV